jgi:hypothetical protein
VRGCGAFPGIWLVGASAIHTVSRRRFCARRSRRRRWRSRGHGRRRRRWWRRRRRGNVGLLRWRWWLRLVLCRRRIRIRPWDRRLRGGRARARGGHERRSEPRERNHHQERAATPGRRPPQAGEPGTPV